MSEVVVVGAGVGGLAAAARLAAAGHRVTVCEAAATVGGKLACYEIATEAGRFRFDTGPTLLTWPQVFGELFTATGDPLDSVLRLRPVDPIAHYRFADGSSVSTVTDLAAQQQAFDTELGAGTGAAWQAVLDRGARIWRAVEQPVLGAELTGASFARQATRLGDLRAVAPGRTLRQLARRYLTDPRQRLMLERYATYEGSDPRRTPAALAVVPYLEHRFGAWYVEGGLHGLAAALADRVRERGGRLLLDTAVAAVETAGGRVHGVRLQDATVLPADVVVSNADAHLLYGSLHQPTPTARRVPAADSLSGFVLMLAVRGHTEGLAHHTVLFGGQDYDAEFDAIFGTPGRPVDDPVLYVNAARDRAVRPDGHEAWYVLVNAARHGSDGRRGELDWTAPGLAEGYAERMLDLLAARGLPVRDRLLAMAVRTPADLERDARAPGGAIYGSVLHGAMATMRRPRNRSRTRGLFLVGGSTHPGGGLPLVALSAKIVAQAVGPA